MASILALLLPASGIIRAVDSFRTHALFIRGNDIEKAKRAGALCMVTRSKLWKPQDGDRITGLRLVKSERTEDMPQRPSYLAELDSFYTTYETMSYSPAKIKWRRCSVHGTFRLPHGYELQYVPTTATISPLDENDSYPDDIDNDALNLLFQPQRVAISSNYSFLKSFIAFFQTVNAGLTLYQARGDQITQYGFVAFGLTVIPYIIMSCLNLLAQLMTPDYSTLYMVESPEMQEARRRGGRFDGVIGKVKNSNDLDPSYYLLKSAEPPNVFTAEKHTIVEGPEALSQYKNDGTLHYIQFDERGKRPISTESKAFYPACAPIAFPKNIQPSKKYVAIVQFGAPIAVCMAWAFITYGLSKFRNGLNSTRAERAWIVSWMVVGMASGAVSAWVYQAYSEVATQLLRIFLEGVKENGLPAIKPIMEVFLLILFILLIFILLGGVFMVPAIGGLVTVGKLLRGYGICQHIG